MRIEPLQKIRRRDYALLTPGKRQLHVQTVHGDQRFNGTRDITNALAKLKGFTCYVNGSLQQFRFTTSAREWVLTTFRGRDVAITHVPTGTKIVSLSGALIDAKDPFLALSTTLEWLWEYGIAPAPVSSMAWKLLRASLADDVVIGFDPEISDPAFFGGRQEIHQPDHYYQVKSLDIKAAYPTAMASRPIAASLRAVHPSTELDPNEPGLAEATVTVPAGMAWYPLPRRVATHAIQFPYGTFSGTWSWVELDAARRLGAEVNVTKCYAPRTKIDLFGDWWQMAQKGRYLPNGADVLAKAVANSTWGQFSMKGEDRSEIWWSDDAGDQPFKVPLPDRKLPHRWGIHVAAEVTARVRTQTLLEGLNDVVGWIVHVDTDGIIVGSDTKLPSNVGDNFGQWRVKEVMNQIDIRAPQFYRYTRDGEPNEWHYVASGQTENQAAYTFNKNRDVLTQISFLSRGDVCVPPANAQDLAANQRILDELEKVAV